MKKHHQKNKSSLKIKPYLWLVAGGMTLTGCSITPTAVTNESQLNNTYKGLHQAIDSQEQINHKVTLAEAIARTKATHI
ncbi:MULTISPECIES: hypothetical protein [Cysteiniphilum]|uniref:hypothetical protein n=1 Tax=Cysteiniphilum TaxID=2056696 RepID=UPI001782F4D6|nr:MULTISPECIES: hypothetical protein [Cysteiniphilum]